MKVDSSPVPEADLSAYVLHVLDDHIAALRDVRDRLRTGGTTPPGGRRAVAIDGMMLAEQFALRLGQALDLPAPNRHDAETPKRHDARNASPAHHPYG
ncbi:hypothetical protein [Mangrovihabitans endophyticus]|uniref:Uncharacterized protein n=1 Tax=Mangrovihabitans endophyticus TaxID=1751298 RepID=A0A8J3C4C2_9ACTN|nr:hypothetical protein [Mangrovihabitans endophyticus]GGL08269.1 hypothetical protein GCM10012284_48480 [Mangrovihabitans endophyticus]